MPTRPVRVRRLSAPTGTRYANDVAAVPSLHAAYTLLIALFFFRRLRSRWRWLLWFYPLAMAFALVYTGEQFAIDILLGWVYCLAVYAALERTARARAARRAQSAMLISHGAAVDTVSS